MSFAPRPTLLALAVLSAVSSLLVLSSPCSALYVPKAPEQLAFRLDSSPSLSSMEQQSRELHSSTAESFPAMKNDLILRAARGEKTERAPVWVMRQAGRYLPEFRKVREEYDFFTICRTPKLATMVTLQPIDRYAGLLDAAIIFSDILVVPQALGLKVEMVPGKGPHLPEPLIEPGDLKRLKQKVDVEKDLHYVFEAVTMTRHALQGRVPLIGFVGAPWTLMAYMVEGGGSSTFSKAKAWLYKYPEASHELLQRITDVCVDFLVGQVRAGSQMLQVFESWGGELGPDAFEEFSLPYLAQIARRVKDELGPKASVPMTIFAKGSWYALEALLDIGYETVSVDWTHTPESVKAITGDRITVQGNLDPSVLLGSDEAIVGAVEKMVRGFGSSRRYIANLGHGILPDVSVDAMETFLRAVHRVGREVADEAEL